MNDKHGTVLPVSNGIDFLGYIIRKEYVLVRRRVVNNLKARLNSFEKRLTEEKNGMKVVRYDYEILEELRAVLALYMGHLKRADTYRLRSALLERYLFLKEYFIFRQQQRILQFYKHLKEFLSIRRQYRYYAGRFSDSVLFF